VALTGLLRIYKHVEIKHPASTEYIVGSSPVRSRTISSLTIRTAFKKKDKIKKVKPPEKKKKKR